MPEPLSDLINWSIFNELLTMDEDEPDFSKSLILTFIEQATQTFQDIDSNLKADNVNLDIISQHGHFLKGSAASLGLIKVQEQCERIQNYGLQKDFDNGVQGRSWEDALREALEKARDEFNAARKVLSAFYNDDL
ncbi:Phosphorelay intermediate protein YPD1 [Cyberlindnera fabianii]|nr:Phosphorelay intermediate protein YPD1 [Cyberlindnera fabianii]